MNINLRTLRTLFYAGMAHLRKRTISDESIKWLFYANPGILDKGNVYCMDLAIKNIASSSPVLEIGSFCGLSTNVISYLLLTHGKVNKIFTCDPWIFEGSENALYLGKSNIKHQEYREYVKSAFKRNVQFFSHENVPYAIESLSDEFFDLWEKNATTSDVFKRTVTMGGRISFCYIDGYHTYEYAKRDFLNTDKYLEKGGYVLFDDSSDRNDWGLTRLMREISKNKYYELIIKNPNYLFRKIA